MSDPTAFERQQPRRRGDASHPAYRPRRHAAGINGLTTTNCAMRSAGPRRRTGCDSVWESKAGH